MLNFSLPTYIVSINNAVNIVFVFTNPYLYTTGFENPINWSILKYCICLRN